MRIAGALHDHRRFAVWTGTGILVMAWVRSRLVLLVRRLVAIIRMVRGAMTFFLMTSWMTTCSSHVATTTARTDDVAQQDRKRRQAGDDVASRAIQDAHDATNTGETGQRCKASAILMCEEASIKDPEIQKLCRQIRSSQQAGIAHVKQKLDELDRQSSSVQGGGNRTRNDEREPVLVKKR
jgi:hypothetical protein